jgi:hypothetical protein
MVPKSMLSGFDPMGGYRFSKKIMLHQISGARRLDIKQSRSGGVEFSAPQLRSAVTRRMRNLSHAQTALMFQGELVLPDRIELSISPLPRAGAS